MQPGIFRRPLEKIIRKSTFTRLKKACLTTGMPQLINLVELLEGTTILISRGELPSLIDLFWATLKYGKDYVRVQHNQPGYYQKWLQRKEPYHWGSITEAQNLRRTPTISIFLTAGGQNSLWLQECLESITQQCYPHWELYLFGLKLTSGNFQDRIRSLFSTGDQKTHFFDKQTLWTMNQMLAKINGQFVVFPDSPDLLAPAALFEVVRLLNRHPKADIIYADEDIIDSYGKRTDPFFKPDWSPDLALSMPYTGRFTVYRTSLVQSLGGLRGELGAAPYDLLLRAMEQTSPQKIQHIPKILYHRRLTRHNTAGEDNSKTELAMSQPLHDHLQRTSQPGRVQAGDIPGTYRVIREIKDTPGVSIIIPFKDNLTLLSQCLASIFQKTDYPCYEVILINNQSREQSTFAYLKTFTGNPQVRLLDYDHPFNYAAMNNLAAEQARYQYILFLNDDTEVISQEWLRAMVEQLQRDEIGAVGAKLLYPDHTIQHGGLNLGGGGLLCGDYFRGLPELTAAGHGLAQVIRNCSAVTGACLLTKKNLFKMVGGLDAVNFAVCYNDVDFCLKLRQQGYLIVWTPYAKLYHHESASRGHSFTAAGLERLYREQKCFETKWLALLDQDPYFNPNLSRLFDGYVY